MNPIVVTIDNNLKLLVVPESEIHLNGHAILTYSYNIYLISRNATDEKCNSSNQIEFEIPRNTSYLGVIMSASPGVYTYDATGPLELSKNEVNKLIEHIDNYRNTPSLWYN